MPGARNYPTKACYFCTRRRRLLATICIQMLCNLRKAAGPCLLRWLVTLWLGLCSPCWALSVVFINPGKPDEVYWASASAAMEQAARSLGMRLEVQYAGRDHVRGLALARQLAQRDKAKRPDYVVLSNDYGAAPEMLRQLDGSGILAFMAFSGVHGRAREETGAPRERYAFWLGSLEPRAEEAGYLTARALIAQARASGNGRAADGRLHLLALAGDRSSPTSIARNAGMRRAVQEAGDVELLQEVFGDWRRDKAQEQARWLFQRHPDARLVWAGNDQMAFGAMAAWRQRGGTPGRDAWFSGINTSPEALAALRSGDLSALAGGHFLTGAWALVMLFDHSRGVDFAGEGLEQQRSLFALFDAEILQQFERRMEQPAMGIDFRRYSKALNPQLKRYGFEAGHWLR